MSYDTICFETEQHLAVVTLNRPNRRNASSLELMLELLNCLERIRLDSELRAVILAAAGKTFCSGHDLSALVGKDFNEYRRTFDVCCDLMTKIQSIPQLVIAEVQGVATAAGCQLVATCDLAIAVEGPSFATPGVRIGLFCTTPMVALSRAIVRKRALEMLLTGDMVPAATAAEWGLVNKVVPAARLREETRTLAGHAGDRQAGLLHTDRSRPAQGVRLRQGDHDYELSGGGCAGRHIRFPGETAGMLGGQIVRSPRRAG
ncbi:MAG TPA: enoyl-CoA hydratase-related protein [Terriglobales bacterium]|nr:enoyl-CoA hydratase-related protein [Terriglobales bacterium]